MKSFKLWLEYHDDKEPHLQGEYWIDGSGGVIYADGDIGDLNHEAIVIQYLQSEIVDHFDYKYNRGDFVDWEKFKKDFAQHIYQQELTKITSPAQKQHLEEEYEGDPDQFFYKGIDELGYDKESIAIAEGKGDARAYAIKRWNWKRVQNTNVETWKLEPKDLKIIAKGLSSAFDEEGSYDNWAEGWEEQISFHISIYATGQSHNLTFAELEHGQMENPQKINAQIVRNQQQATKQVRDIELAKLAPYYQQRTFPFGDGKLSFHRYLQQFNH